MYPGLCANVALKSPNSCLKMFIIDLFFTRYFSSLQIVMWRECVWCYFCTGWCTTFISTIFGELNSFLQFEPSQQNNCNVSIEFASRSVYISMKSMCISIFLLWYQTTTRASRYNFNFNKTPLGPPSGCLAVNVNNFAVKSQKVNAKRKKLPGADLERSSADNGRRMWWRNGRCRRYSDGTAISRRPRFTFTYFLLADARLRRLRGSSDRHRPVISLSVTKLSWSLRFLPLWRWWLGWSPKRWVAKWTRTCHV